MIAEICFIICIVIINFICYQFFHFLFHQGNVQGFDPGHRGTRTATSRHRSLQFHFSVSGPNSVIYNDFSTKTSDSTRHQQKPSQPHRRLFTLRNRRLQIIGANYPIRFTLNSKTIERWSATRTVFRGSANCIEFWEYSFSMAVTKFPIMHKGSAVDERSVDSDAASVVVC